MEGGGARSEEGRGKRGRLTLKMASSGTFLTTSLSGACAAKCDVRTSAARSTAFIASLDRDVVESGVRAALAVYCRPSHSSSFASRAGACVLLTPNACSDEYFFSCPSRSRFEKRLGNSVWYSSSRATALAEYSQLEPVTGAEGSRPSSAAASSTAPITRTESRTLPQAAAELPAGTTSRTYPSRKYCPLRLRLSPTSTRSTIRLPTTRPRSDGLMVRERLTSLAEK